MKKKIDIYLDQVNILSLFVILIQTRISNINRIYYIDYSFTLGVDFFFKKIKFVNCNKFEESRIKINNKYVHLHIWQLLTDLSNKFIIKDKFLNNNHFIKKNSLNYDKYIEFLREKFIYQAYVPLKLYVYSQKFSKNNNTKFLIEKNALSPVFDVLSENFFYYYNIFFYAKIKKHKSMYFNFLYFRYFSFKIFLFKIIYLFLSRCIKGIIKSKKISKQKKLGIDILQREIDLDNVTDLYWLKNSKIKKEDICAISHVKWDIKSLENLKKFDLKNLYFASLPFFLKDFFRILILLPFLFIYVFKSRTFSGWKKFHEYLYLVQSIYYSSIYKMQNISVYFSMLDVDQDKLVKAQGLELNNALFIQSHWSNFPTFKKINQKCCDILFTWSPHFIKNNFSYFPFKKIYSVGFPSDHYFENVRKEKIEFIDNKFNFRISYMDNVFYNDIYYGKTISVKIIKMFLRLLEKHSNLELFLKPKSKLNFEKLKKKIPILKKYIDSSRVKIFFGSGFNEKFNPAKLAKISNLVVGLGVSSVAAEASFFGTTSFHFDNLKLQNENEFCKNNLNKIVFDDIEKLEKAINDQILNQKMTTEENKLLHAKLDPFQDGNAGLRTALIIDLIFKKHDKLKNLDSLFEEVNNLIINNKAVFKETYSI